MNKSNYDGPQKPKPVEINEDKYWGLIKRNEELQAEVEKYQETLEKARPYIINSEYYGLVCRVLAKNEMNKMEVKKLDDEMSVVWVDGYCRFECYTELAEEIKRRWDLFDRYDGPKEIGQTWDRPNNIVDGLRMIAKWFDHVNENAGTGKDTVQQDLRMWADEVERNLKVLVKIKREVNKYNAGGAMRCDKIAALFGKTQFAVGDIKRGEQFVFPVRRDIKYVRIQILATPEVRIPCMDEDYFVHYFAKSTPCERVKGESK